jgi:hypothetical protein
MLSLCELSFTYSLKFADSSEHRLLLTTIGPAEMKMAFYYQSQVSTTKTRNNNFRKQCMLLVPAMWTKDTLYMCTT